MKYTKDTTEIVKNIIFNAGIQLNRLYYSTVTVEEKTLKDYVTSADIEIDTYLKLELSKIDNRITTYSEEQNKNELLKNQWIIDPMDGTTNFILGIPHFSISIAYIENSDPVAAFVYNSMTHELFWTDPWNDAMLNGDMIKVSQRRKIEEMYGLFGFSANIKNIKRYYEEWTEVFSQSKKSIGILSPSLSICAVARGKADFFIDFGCSTEGQVAGSLILKKAGGRLWNYNKSKYN
ncbi:MAG: inositol monophosphatase, partial [Spirochaetota bacterium]